ncbi:three-Cys-motif partner protein TcmP [Roseibacillus persicicus]|uniref:three-Cys-motif partner protein TcmP n=1 Tax=Roseibacillus persicicus TaxID=454148 RepID=UPI00280FF889|nr:three-Cys-motif partner protein TcmP [Roseibacillus persicicus]MDQ8192719.1 three-Cys-motif partner protein TcmP [Roseibacillus persicicus]
MARESQNNLLPHSEAKVELLKRYLEAYLGVISHNQFTEEININDLLCGQGLFPGQKQGSPVMIGRLIEAHLEKFPNSPRIKFRFRFNDLNKKKVEGVTELLLPIEKKHSGKLELLPSTKPAEEVIKEVTIDQEFGKKRMFFNFIDPYGYADIRFQSILQLLENRNSEVLLFQPTSFLFRFSEKGTPLALAHFLEYLNDGKPWPQGLDRFSNELAVIRSKDCRLI